MNTPESIAAGLWQLIADAKDMGAVEKDLIEKIRAYGDARAAEEKERAAQVAEAAARRHETCPRDCRCADGWHIAAAIRKGPDA